MKKTVALGNCRFEIVTEKDLFVGLGAIWIGKKKVRCGRLPIRPFTQSFKGHEIAALRFLGVEASAKKIRVKVEAEFKPMAVKLLRDHSFDPIHDTADWDQQEVSGTGRLDIVLQPATDTFGGVTFAGFSYHYEYKSATIPLFYILDRATWELDGNVTGATVVSQSSCSDPLVTFKKDTAWSTEGLMHWDLDAPNPVMTHNLPRWASHQAFDFQYRGSDTLVGVFGRVELIRSLLQRQAGKAELKTFDKHIFDQALQFATSPKKIMLNEEPKTEVDQRNLWTWTFDEVHNRARGEFGLAEEPMIPRLSINFWGGFTVDSYYRDLLPAAANIGIKQLFLDNLKKSAMTDKTPFPGKWAWNMCCGHEYEIAPELGGNDRVKAFVDICRKQGIQPMSWTNNDQALSSPINRSERAVGEDYWFVLLEDTRQKWGGAYMGCMSVLDFAAEGARRYFVDSHIKIRKATGLNGYLFDSFYNLAFFPVNYANGKPRTMWRQLLQAFKELQDNDVHFLIESFGPFGQPQHGCPRSYSIDRCWVVYKVGLGNDYTTIPSGPTYVDPRAGEAAALYYVLAHMTCPSIPMFKDGKRIDDLWTAAHKSALADYNNNRPQMSRRYLQEDDKAIIWHDPAGKQATIWNFAGRTVALAGKVRDLTTGLDLPPADTYALQACHTYAVTGTKQLPTKLG